MSLECPRIPTASALGVCQDRLDIKLPGTDIGVREAEEEISGIADGVLLSKDEQGLWVSVFYSVDGGRNWDFHSRQGKVIGLTDKQIKRNVAEGVFADRHGIEEYRKPTMRDNRLVSEMLAELGYDGTIAESSNLPRGHEYIVFRPEQIKSATDNNGAFSTKTADVMDAATEPKGERAMTLKEIAAMAIAQDEAENAALEVALEYLRNEPEEPVRASFPKVKTQAEIRAAKANATAMDAGPASIQTDLERHDARFHPDGFDATKDTCKFREALASNDDPEIVAEAEKEEHKEKYGSLSAKNRDEYLRRMKKKHPELNAGKVLSEIGKIADRKIQADAFAWVMRGAVKLPEDLYKVEQARELATKAKVDPMQYDTPQACINDLLGQGHKVSLKPITVEELKKDPLFSDYQKLPYGVETFEVEDSKDGQRRMREIIDTHWGKDANPWCLLARSRIDTSDKRWELLSWWQSGGREDCGFGQYAITPTIEELERLFIEHNGELRTAWNYWNHYNALPKRVAFKDGKLLAFMGTDFPDFDSIDSGEDQLSEMYPKQYEMYQEWQATEEGQNELASFHDWLGHEYPELLEEGTMREHIPEQWWDRQDSPHRGIPIGALPVKDDPFGRWALTEIQGKEPRYVQANGRKWQNGQDQYKVGYIAWHDNGQKAEELTSEGRQKWYEDGTPQSISERDISADFYPDGSLKVVRNYGGSEVVKEPMSVRLGGHDRIDSADYTWQDAEGETRHATAVRDGGTGQMKLQRGSEMALEALLSKAQELMDKAKGRFGKKESKAADGRGFEKYLASA